MEIHFQQANPGNYLSASRGKKEIRYLVIHFTANDGDTAKNNADYFKNSNISTSAHYFVDEKEVWQSVRDADVAWHCGTKVLIFIRIAAIATALALSCAAESKMENIIFSRGQWKMQCSWCVC